MPQEKRPRNRGDLYLVLDIKFPDSSWKPNPALKDMLPTTFAQSTLESSEGAQPSEAAGVPISKAEFEDRVFREARNARGADEYSSYGYQDQGPGCQQQ
ncbi:DnaJ-like protein xdj1 [Coemansia sp. RSA 1290]|nr:DnaJ-like protein xdj1 [Coemansia sp. RSA 1290]